VFKNEKIEIWNATRLEHPEIRDASGSWPMGRLLDSFILLVRGDGYSCQQFHNDDLGTS
jgi:hypothetical protein